MIASHDIDRIIFSDEKYVKKLFNSELESHLPVEEIEPFEAEVEIHQLDSEFISPNDSMIEERN